MEENKSLHVFLMLLLRTTDGEGVLEQNRQESRDLQTWEEHWELKFARDLCQEYEPRVWLPALVKLLKATSASASPAAIQFITYQIQGLSANTRLQVPQVVMISSVPLCFSLTKLSCTVEVKSSSFACSLSCHREIRVEFHRYTRGNCC